MAIETPPAMMESPVVDRAAGSKKKKFFFGVGALVIVAAAATAIAVSMTKSGSNSSSSTSPVSAPDSGTNSPSNNPLPTATSSSPTIVIKEKKVNNIQLPKAPPATDIPTKPTCPSSRNSVSGDTVFMTIDDGPSIRGRMNLLMALAQINQTISFFESAYNFCGSETFYEQSLQCEEPNPYSQVTDLFAYTIKQGHFLASHSDTHYYDNATARCEYATIEKRTKIDPQYESCGNSPVSDMVRGALRIQTALNNDSLWDNDQEFSLYQQAMTNIWTYARLPCTSAWRLPNYSKTTMLGGKDSEPAEAKARNDVADTMFSGNVPCRNETFQGKPWMTIGWDVEWRWQSLTDMEAAKCAMFKTIEGNFAWGGRDQQRKQEVVVLAHDYHYDSPAKAKMFRDLLVELKLHGYKLDTVNNLKIYNNTKDLRLAMDGLSPNASPESTIAPRKGRPLRSLWSMFTNKPNAHIIAEGPKAPCKHCQAIVLHHNKTACVERHLRKCPPFISLMASMHESQRPEWFVRPSKKSTDSSSGDTKIRERPMTPSSDIISLNVGGTVFQTTRETLLQHENSLFHHLLQQAPTCTNDAYFIDVNPKAFEAVLDYLRYDELCLDDMTTWERKKVLKTFAYLKLPVPNVGWDPSTGVISTRNGFSPGATV